MKKYFLIILLIFLNGFLFAECYDLTSQAECEYWTGFCEWNEEANQCEEIGGGGGGGDGEGINYGPYQYQYLTESDGIRLSTLYDGTLLYYPTDAQSPYASIVLIDAFGDEYGLQTWAQFYASHGFIAMTIGNFDPEDRDLELAGWDYEDRAIGLLDAIKTIKGENVRELSPLNGLIDTISFAVSGYSTSGGGAHVAATMDSTLKAAVLLNPAVLFLDSVNCSEEMAYYCLIEEHLDHDVPVLIYAGENELTELGTGYDSVWAPVQYDYVPETTDKVYFESSGQGHGSSYFPIGGVGDYALAWLNYYLKGDESYCEYLIQEPESTSQFLTTLECFSLPSFDINGDGVVNNSDFTMLLVFVLNGDTSISASDINFDSKTDIFDMLILSDYLQNL